LINVAEFAFLDQLDEKPEGECGGAMHQKLPNQKIHSLNIIRLIIVARKGSQHIPQLLVARLPWIEKLVLRKRPPQIPINLQRRLLLRLQLLQTFIMLLAFLILIKYYLRDVDFVVQFLLPSDLKCNNIGSEPPHPILTRKPIRRILIALTLQIVLHFLQFHPDLLP